MLPTRFLVAGSTLAFLSVSPLAAQTTERANVSSAGAQADDDTWGTQMSADGRYVVFESWATTLVANDTNNMADVFVRDLQTGLTVCVSLDPAGLPANSLSEGPSISADGRFVAFASLASNLVAGDTNGVEDIFVRDLVAGTTILASRNSAGQLANNTSYEPSISGDGTRVAFSSAASNLSTGDINQAFDVFVRDLSTGQTQQASVNNAGAEGNGQSRFPVLSRDGHCIAFYTEATNLVTPDTNLSPDAIVRDLLAGTTERVSVSTAGVQANQATDYYLSISADGRFVAFASTATNLVAGDTTGTFDLYLRDRLQGQTSCVSLDQASHAGTGHSHRPALTDDARFVAFASSSPSLVAGDTNSRSDVFVHDRQLGRTTRVSLTSTGTQSTGDSGGYQGISANGRWIAFDADASDLVPADTNGLADSFARDRGVAAPTPFCFGDGTQATPCPCANSGATGRGCENSAASGGALLEISAFAADPDSATLVATGVVSNALTIFLQGNAQLAGLPFGDGVRCVGGALKRLYVTSANSGVANAPTSGNLPLGLQSAFLGDPIVTGTSRWYQAWYRDADASFCAAPQGGLSNVTNGVRVDW